MKQPRNSKGEALFEQGLKAIGLSGYERNARFLKDRKFEIDFLWRDEKVGCEISGGLWMVKSGHKFRGQRRDYEKANRAVMEGIRLLTFSTEMVQEDPIGCAKMVAWLLDKEG